MGDDQHAHVARRGDGVDAVGDDVQRVDVEARVGLVEDRDRRLLERELEDLQALLLAAGEALVEVARGELARDVGELHRRLDRLAEVLERDLGSSPRASRCAFMTMRRYFVTVTPGIATGYWKAMKRPMRARSSGSASVMSSPWKRIWPSVTSRPGGP